MEKVKFGGYTVKFEGCSETLEQVFGKEPIAPSKMTKKLWNYIKTKQLASK